MAMKLRSLVGLGVRQPQFVYVPQRNLFGLFGQLWRGKEQFKKEQAKFGQNRKDSYRAEYEREIKERTETKLNWGIKNRWEQRALDDIFKNQDIRMARFKDFQKIQQESMIWGTAKGLREFFSVDEIFYFMEHMFVEGMSEKQISMALDIFVRDAGLFQEEDLKSETFQMFLRELSQSLVTFVDEKTYVKTAKFLDIYCIEDKYLWVNLEMFLMKKEKMFSPKTLIQIMSHFASQNEGSRDFYDFIEFNFYSQTFQNASTHDLVSLGYNFYLVHAGTISFFEAYADFLLQHLDDSVPTFDLLRVLQTFSEISQRFVKVFTQLEVLFLKRFDQLTIDEMTCSACGFAISGFGSNYLFSLLEAGVMANFSQFQPENVKEICRGFIFSFRGSKKLHEAMLPRVEAMLHQFSHRELCYLAHAYWKHGVLTKQFARTIEDSILPILRDIEKIDLEDLVLFVRVFCTTRSGSRDFHKLLETAVLMRMEDLKKNMKMLYAIGQKFEESGLCSLDTLKILKKEVFMREVEEDVFA